MPPLPADGHDPRGALYHQAPPMNVTMDARVEPQVEALMRRLLSEGRDFRLDGVEVFAVEDKFLPGKIAIAMAHLIAATPRSDPKFAEYVRGFRQLADLTIEDANDTWGIYYYASALHRLDTAGLRDEAVSPSTLERLKVRLDWRSFVREGDLTLIDLPNNYYGVAFSIARLRFLLGWEDAAASDALLAKTLDHFRTYSGVYGFADETAGEGRFDRYSVLLIGEIAQRFIETGIEPPADVRRWLRNSVDVMLPRLNLRGEGFEYGRSIGVYGETAFLEVLTAAAALNVLTDQEEAMAYAFSARVAARYADFWLDPATGSVNLWDHGRKTDAYRGKHRILGENLSLAHQLSYTNALWNRLGWADREPDAGFEAWLDTLPRSTTTWFSRGQYDRVLVTYRDGDRVIGLPLINGGPTHHMNNPYFPVPFSPGVLSGAADETWPNLVPRVTLSDGSVLMPLAWISGVAVEVDGPRTIVTYVQTEWDLMGDAAPRRDSRLSVRTRYILEPGAVSRSDSIQTAPGVEIAHIDLDFASFSQAPLASPGQINFGAGEVRSFATTGLTCLTRQPDPDRHASPTGAFNVYVECDAGAGQGARNIGWRIEMRQP
ncbi:MAG: hypothetical protein M3Q74_00395 [Pseudomonadota bacterium]|nr:hypothetical protein [Pseudomonadota bacterium]